MALVGKEDFSISIMPISLEVSVFRLSIFVSIQTKNSRIIRHVAEFKTQDNGNFLYKFPISKSLFTNNNLLIS